MTKIIKKLIIFSVGFLLILPLFVFAYQKPSVLTREVTNITKSSVTLNGEINDLGGVGNLTAWFQYGQTQSYGKETPSQAFSSPGSLSELLSPLPSCTLYHFRVAAKNIMGTTFGEDKTFITKCPSLPPTVDIKANDSDGPIVVKPNTTITLKWTSENAEYCSPLGDWQGIKSNSGSETIQNLNYSKTFSINCWGPGGSVTDSVMVNVLPNLPPVAKAGPDKEVYGGKSVVLEGSASDPNKDPLTYSWSCTGGNLSYPYTLQPTFLSPSVPQDATFDCRLTVTDNEGKSNSDLMQVLVKKQPPVSTSVAASEPETPKSEGVPTLVSTGLTNNLFLDSFFLPLILTLLIIWLFRSHILNFEEWFDLRKEEYRKYRTNKLLRFKIAQIKAREFLHKRII